MLSMSKIYVRALKWGKVDITRASLNKKQRLNKRIYVISLSIKNKTFGQNKENHLFINYKLSENNI